MFADYANFEIDIQPRAGAVFPFAVRAPGGDARGTFAPPAADPAYRALAARLAALDTDEDLLTAIGQILFGALFHGQVKEVYARSQGMLRPGQGLRIRLSVDPREAEVAALPWELLNDPDLGPLALLDAPIVRYIPQPLATPTLKASLPLKVLLSGGAQAGADAERELNEVHAALALLGDHVQVTLEPRISVEALQRRLREGFDIWHFVGQGGFGDDGATGRIVLDGPGGGKPISGPELGIMLNRSRVRLVVLDTCDSARLATDPFRSLAPALVRAQVPAVVAMQSTIPGDAARAFAKNFYQALAEGFPLDTCMTEGRKGVMSAAGLGRADWAIPVVYTRAPDGVLFDLPAPVTSTLPGAIVSRPANGGAAAEVGIHSQAGALLAAPPPGVVQLGAAPSPPRRRRDFRDREAEQRDLLAEMRPGGGAWLYGAPGCGLSTLLNQLAAATPAGALPHGVVCVDGADEPPHLDDVLQRLFARFYTASVTTRVDAGTAQTYLGQLRALFVLDRLPLSYDDLTQLVELALPNSAALVAADGEGPATLLDLPLGSLPRADAVALCASIARLDAARPEVGPSLDRICAALGDLPLPLLLAARVIRQRAVAPGQLAAVLEDMAAPGQGDNRPPLALAVQLSLTGLSEQERAILAAVVVGKPHAHIDTLAGSTGLAAPDVRTLLQGLIGLGLVLGNEDRYEIMTTSLRRVLEELLRPERERSRAAAFLAGAAGLRAGDLAWIERERGNLMQAIETLLSEGRAAEAGALAKSVQPALVLGGLWGSWGDVIDRAAAAARQSGDRNLAAWALHERGTRAGLLGDRAGAADALDQALRLRRQLGDHVGAAATRRNMAYLGLFPAIPPTTSGGGRTLRLAGAAGIVALLVALIWIARPLVLGQRLPIASAQASPSSGGAPLAVTFDASGSRSVTGAALLFIWDFDDGTVAETTDSTTSHTYERPGTYRATLRVRDGDGRTSRKSAPLLIDVHSLTAPTNTPTNTPTLTSTPVTPSPTADTPTATPTPTMTDTPTSTPTPTSSPTVTPTPTSTPTPGPPDLVVTSLAAGQATASGRSVIQVPVRVVAANQGGTVAGIFKVSVRYTDVTGASYTVAFTVDGQADRWYPYTVEPLTPGGAQSFSGVLTFPSSAQNQVVTISALADSCDGDELMPDYCRVAESDEKNNQSEQVEVNLRPSNPPAVEISSPAGDIRRISGYDGYDEQSRRWYKDVELVGAAGDQEDGAIGGTSLVWTTDQRYQNSLLGTGEKIVARLYLNGCSTAVHTITLTAVDSDRNMSQATRRIAVGTICESVAPH